MFIAALRRLARGSGGGNARGLLRVWLLWERLASYLWSAPLMPGSHHGLLRLRFSTYRGKPVELPDRTRILSGDLVGEIHTQNRRLSELTVESPWHILPPFRDELATLAAWTLRPDFPRDVQAFHALSLLGRACRGLGFTTSARSVSLQQRLEQMYMLGLLEIYSHEGVQRLASGGTRAAFPEDIWISRASLVKLHGPGGHGLGTGLNALTDAAE